MHFFLSDVVFCHCARSRRNDDHDHSLVIVMMVMVIIWLKVTSLSETKAQWAIHGFPLFYPCVHVDHYNYKGSKFVWFVCIFRHHMDLKGMMVIINDICIQNIHAHHTFFFEWTNEWMHLGEKKSCRCAYISLNEIKHLRQNCEELNWIL